MNVEIVSASAGTGKTQRLCDEIVHSLTAPPEQRARISGLVAVTYTRKAEAELRRRIRRALIAQGLVREARHLPLAYCGTIHAVCLRLLNEHALSIGLPPELDVLSDEDADLELARALEKALPPAERARFDGVCARVQPNLDVRSQRYNWLADAQDLIELARSNRITSAMLPAMAQQSADGLLALFDEPARDGKTLDARLAEAVDRAIGSLERTHDETVATANTLDDLHDARRRHAAGMLLPWSLWLKLAKLAPAVDAKPLVAPVQELAAAHMQHPRFHDDLRSYITTLYTLVARGLDDYSHWKHTRRLLDYVDMEERALHLLEQRAASEHLRQQLDLVVVDEFQDTSPIQLALFLRLASLAKRSIWVGDRKQSIFAFRGADPALMESVIADVEHAGQKVAILDVNHRSRPSLVELTSRLFARALAKQGHRVEHVRTQPIRREEELDPLPPLGCWWLESINQPQDAMAIARGVAQLLAAPDKTPVVDREQRRVRGVQREDIAILAATNDETRRIADALDALAIPCVVPRAGLLQTPEGTLLHAALRFVVDDWDRAAAAELDALAEYDGRSPDEWLSECIRARAGGTDPARRGLARVVDEMRAALTTLSPVEAIDCLIAALALPVRCRRWPRPAQRLANLDAFAALAQQYEHHCAYAREAASLAGFLHFLDVHSGSGADAQMPLVEDAVQVCTYHRAKGLEWPVVILAGLDARSRVYGLGPDAARARLERGQHHRVFGAAPETNAPFDAQDPLAGRWLRMWPWPYAAHRTAPLGERAAATAEAQRIVDRQAGESLRLLYVGFTRARDHLILAARLDKKTGIPKVAWLHSIRDGETPLLELPRGEREREHVAIAGERCQFAARVWRLAPDTAVAPSSATHNQLSDFACADTPRPMSLPYRIRPAAAASEWPELPTPRIGRIHRIGGRVAFAVPVADQAEAGAAIHAFLAADRSELGDADRAALARTILTARHFSEVLGVDDLVTAAKNFQRFIDANWPNAVWHREMPVSAALDSQARAQRVSGMIDLLLETTNGWVIVDHKTFPGGEAAWPNEALSHASQLAAYREILNMGGVSPVLACLVHFPIGGGVVELEC